MSFKIITQSRRPRGLGTGPFISTITERAGVAIGESIRAGRATSMPRVTRAPSGGGMLDTAPRETPAGSELDCGCLAKRATEALVHLGADPAELGDAVAECEADPDAFFAAIAGFFPEGVVPACAWYEVPSKRNMVIGVGAAVGVVTILGLALRKRRK